MKKRIILFIALLLCFALSMSAQASTFSFAAPESTYEPFLAETGELAVNVREAASTNSGKAGQFERGQQLTVTGETTDENGVVWYEVQLADGTLGYIRSDLLMTAEEAAAEHAAASAAQEEQLIGNVRTKKYHEIWCHTLPKESNRKYFDTAREAEAEGYVHCKNCD